MLKQFPLKWISAEKAFIDWESLFLDRNSFFTLIIHICPLLLQTKDLSQNEIPKIVLLSKLKSMKTCSLYCWCRGIHKSRHSFRLKSFYQKPHSWCDDGDSTLKEASGGYRSLDHTVHFFEKVTWVIIMKCR